MIYFFKFYAIIKWKYFLLKVFIMEKRVFISHSSKDSEAANQICELLESSGLKCWIAPRDIPFSSVWAGEISKAISESSAFLFLSSQASNQSPHVSREIQLAVESMVPIIPIHLDDTPYSDANKYYLATIHCMVEYNANKIHKLAADIIKLIPKQEAANKNEVNEEITIKKEKPQKKKNPTLYMLLHCIGCAIASFIGTCVFFLTDLPEIIKIALAVIIIIAAFVPVFISRGKALKKIYTNRSSVNLITLLAFVLVIAIAAGGYLIDYNSWYNNMDDKYHITISAPENMSATDFTEASETVLKRLEIFAGDTRYTAKTGGDSIDVIIPRELFMGENPENVMKLYITRAMKHYICTSDFHWNESAEDSPRHIPLSPDDIESAQIKYGSLDGVDPAVVGTDEENYEYIEVVLKKDFYDKNSKAIESYGDKIAVALDKKDFTSYWYFNAKQYKDSNVIYILNDDSFENANETALYNLTHSPLKTSLYFNIDIAPVFETVEDNDKAGVLQCNADTFKKDYVTFVLKSTFTDITDGEWQDTEKEIKNRLDTIGLPYAYGKTEFNPFSAVIRTTTDRMGIPIMQLIAAKSLKLSTDFTETSLYSYSDKLMPAADDSGNPCFTLNSDEKESIERYKGLASIAEKSKTKKLYISTNNGVKILATDCNIDENNPEIIFKEVVLTQNSEIDRSTSWIPLLAYTIYKSKKLINLDFDSFEFSSDEMSEKDFGINLGLDELEKTVKEINPDAEISYTGTQLNINLFLPVDDKLPENLLEAGKKIYQSYDFEGSIFHTIGIYAIDEVEQERSRIFFSKYTSGYYGYENHTDGYTYVYGIFSGGRIQRDHDRFIELVYADEFYKPFIREDEGSSKSFT